MNKKEQIMKDKFTEVEKSLINAINNFVLWNTTEEDRELVEEYISEEKGCGVDYNDWFLIKHNRRRTDERE